MISGKAPPFPKKGLQSGQRFGMIGLSELVIPALPDFKGPPFVAGF